ncbi:MAG: acyl carrier protein [Chloroflexota bacterium]
MKSEKTTAQIHEFVVSNFLFDSGNIADDASLMGEGVIDSTGILELVMFVEESFGIVVTDDEVVPENFDSISALARYITSKLLDTPVALAS